MSYIKHKLKKIIFKIIYNPMTLKINKIGDYSSIKFPRDIYQGKYIFIGNETTIGKYCCFRCYTCNKKPKLIIGDKVYAGNNISIRCSDEIIIQDECLLGSYITIVDTNHGINPESSLNYRFQNLTTKKVEIGSGTWIGDRCVITAGVSIGKKCIIGAGSVVTKDIPDYCIAVGNPAKVIKKYNFDTHNWEKIK